MFPVWKVGVAVVFCFFAMGARGQDGFRWQETPGLALIKPQAWSDESKARVMEFEAFIDRRATGGSAAGYIEFRLPSGQSRQVEVGKIFRVVVYPDAEKIRDLATDEDRARTATSVSEIVEVVKRFPATRSYIEPELKAIEAELARFDRGEVKVDGTWIPKSAYVEVQARRLMDMLRSDLASSPDSVVLDLETDTRYRDLAKIGETSPAARKMAVEIREAYAKRARAQKRSAIVKSLAGDGLTAERGRELIGELRALKPAENPDHAALLDQWQNADSEATALAKVAAELAGPLEESLGGIEDYSVAPTIPSDTADAVASLSRRYAKLKEGGAPAPLLAELGQAESVVAVTSSLAGLGEQLPKRDLFAAKEALDAASVTAAGVGPNAEAAVSGYQKHVSEQVEMFVKVRAEAQAHEEAGQPAEALAKYREAFALIPDAGVGEKITEIEATQPAS